MSHSWTARTLPCKPRCCESCQKRGTQENPLEPWSFEGTDGKFREFWVHNACAVEISQAENCESASAIALVRFDPSPSSLQYRRLL